MSQLILVVDEWGCSRFVCVGDGIVVIAMEEAVEILYVGPEKRCYYII